MADNQTRLTIEIQTILRNLNRTLKGLDQVKRKLESIAAIRPGQQGSTATNRATLAAQRLSLQQQRLNVQTLELANRQERARQASERLTLSQQRLSRAQEQVTKTAGLQADAHVRMFRALQRGVVKAPAVDAHVRAFKAIEKSRRDADAVLRRAPPVDAHVRAFRAIERAAADADSHVRAYRASQAALKKAPQLDAHVRAFRAIQKGAADADSHVKAFRATQAALAKAPQLDAHVRAFRALEAATKRSQQSVLALGNAFRSLGQGLASLGATLSVSVTAPLAAASVASVDAAVRLDSLKRGLAAIVGSTEEANRQLARLTQLAKLPGIGFEEAIQGSIRLQAVGFSAAEAERNLREFSNAVALTGGGRDELARVTVQLGQLAAKGRVLSQDLRPIIEAAPAVGRALLQAFGTVNAADIQELGLTTEEFLAQLTSELSRLPRAAAGAKNSFENFRDEVFRAAAAVGTALLPTLTRLAEVLGPVIIKLADAFAALPGPLQTVVIGAVALVAAIGPVSFIVGQLVLGVGRLVVSFAELNALGIGPTIANLRRLTAGTLGAAAAQRTLASTTALVTAGIGAGLAVLAVAATAYAIYNAFQKDATALSKEQADALTDQIKGLKDQVAFIDQLKDGVERTADEQERLLEIYGGLNRTAKVRITSISDETERLAAQREELAKLVALREQERVQAAASVVAELANNLVKLQANEQERDAIAARIQANTALIETLEREQAISVATTRALAERGITANDVQGAIGALKTESEALSETQDELIKSAKELADTSKDQATIVQELERRTGLTARQLLIAAQSMGKFRGDVLAIIPVLERYVKTTDEATRATKELSEAQILSRAGEAADKEIKRRQENIKTVITLSREAAGSFEEAVKHVREFLTTSARVRQDFQREAELQGKTIDEFIRDSLEGAFGRGGDRGGAALRNAREQLADALLDVSKAEAEQRATIEKTANDALLRANENAYRLQLSTYRQYLEARALLTENNLKLEIEATATEVSNAKLAQARLLKAAQESGIPAAETVKRQAQAAGERERAIRAETKLKELEAERAVIIDELNQALRESAKEQARTIRELDAEFAELRGSIEAALNTQTALRFNEALEQLGKAQDNLNKKQKRPDLTAEQREEIRLAKQRNQNQIEAIQGIVTQENALASLAAAQELVRRAVDKQARLEAELTFEVEHRGLTEEEAIKRRLAGEDKLNDKLTLAHETVRQIVAALQARGVDPPQALLEFLEELRIQTQGLGKLSFSEQFRLAQKEFDRLNDERIAKIQDVERAVRNRDIAEVEGAIIIRRINGQYTADLEAQLVLLKQIAKASGQEELRRQAEDAGEIVKDTKDEVASLGRQIESAGKDAFRSGLTDFFNDILNRTVSAKEALLNLLDSVVSAINDVIAENLSKQLFESLFGGPESTQGGIIASIKRLFGFGDTGLGSTGGAGGSLTSAVTGTAEATALTTGATAAATALTTGGTAAGTAMVTGGTTVATALTAAAGAFAAAVTAAGAAFAASVVAGAGAQAVGGVGGALGAATGLFPAVPGGVYKVVEGGYPEAVLTTDPRQAQRQLAILRAFLRETRGLGGRVKGLATGGFAMPDLTVGFSPAPALGGLSDIGPVGAPNGESRFRFVLTDQRSERDWWNSSEGEQVFREKLYRNAPAIRKIGGNR
jgi:tape measure domain-containing protein